MRFSWGLPKANLISDHFHYCHTICSDMSGDVFCLQLAGINGEWGGRPYKDLENCFEYVKENMRFVDTDNAIAAGASYGGYMANWIQGNPLGRKFKTIVCHDGVFSMQNSLSSVWRIAYFI